MMRISAMSQHRAQAVVPDPKWHVISIATPGNAPAVLANGFGRVTYVRMSDNSSPEREAISKAATAAALAMAEGAERLIVHCEMGVSRSVGAARAIAECYGVPFEHEFPGSRAVHAAMKRELGGRCR